MNKIIAVYKITNIITGDFYIGSSKNIKHRWADHKCPSIWNKCPNNPMYLDMQRYGVDKFEFEVLAEVEIDKLKEREQYFIETLKPTYNDRNANGIDVERQKEYEKSDKRKESRKKYNKSDKGKEARKKYKKSDKGKEAQKKYNKSDKRKESQKKYNKSDKGKEVQKKAVNKYQNQLCCYNGETLTLAALRERFKRKGIPHPAQEAKKYLIKTPIEFYDIYP